MVPAGENESPQQTSSNSNRPSCSRPSSSVTHYAFLTPQDSGSAILESIGPPSLSVFKKITDLTMDDVDLQDTDSGRFHLPDVTYPSFNGLDPGRHSSFILIDAKEHLKVCTSDQFTSQLRCDSSAKVKVVSIFGNTGDGKSHTLNHVFFHGNEVFPESSQQASCTLGVRAAFSPEEKVICLDTEGLLGATTREQQRTRLLLKILAISDLVLYRTKAERLHKDLFSFLGSASKAYSKHFSEALSKLTRELGSEADVKEEQPGACSLGPAVLIFHETRHTQPLQPTTGGDTPELQLRSRFSQLHLDLQAFSSLRYVGLQTLDGITDFSTVKAAVLTELGNSAVRSARPAKLVLQALRLLNDKFSGQLLDDSKSLFPAEYFSCPATCASCNRRCEHSMGHIRDGKPHIASTLCSFQHQFQNCEYLCVACYNNGQRQVVYPKMASANDQSSWFGVAKYAWSGYVLECAKCGVIYRSRQYWYGNKVPEKTVVRTEVCHIWDNSGIVTTGHNTARRVLDGVTQITEAMASVSAAPSKALSSWVADQIAPKYWTPNSELTNCSICNVEFSSEDTKHHCRACGHGFCDTCSSFSRPVPERGWGQTPVRVCKNCQDPRFPAVSTSVSGELAREEVRVRKYGEAVVSTLSSVASAVLDYPKDLIKDSVRPDYWVPDNDIEQCCVCRCELPTAKLRAHHCRSCGQGVCHPCSSQRRPVPSRGWDTPVRVCDSCFKRD